MVSRPVLFAFIAAIASGLLVACGFPGDAFPTLSLSWLLPFAMVPLFSAMDRLPSGTLVLPRGRKSARREGARTLVSSFARWRLAFFLSWAFGAALASVAFFWVTAPAILFGKVPPPAAYAGFAAYCLLSGAFFAIVLLPFSINAGRMAKRGTRPWPLLPMVLVATALEFFTPRFFFWTLGSLLHGIPALNQWASFFGFSAGSAFILLSNAWLARAFTATPRSGGRMLAAIGGVIALWGTLYGVGALRMHSLSQKLDQARKTRVGVIQPNFTFSELSSNPERSADAQEQSLDVLLRMTRELAQKAGSTPLDLIIWPESVAPSDFAWSQPQLAATKELAREIRSPILIQAIEFDDQELKDKGYRRATMFSNSFLIRPDGSKSASFRKWVPIPFGESVPFEAQLPWLGELVRANIGNTSKVGIGTSYAALPYSPDDFVAPLVCFDAIEPKLPRLQALKGNATLYVNQANFVWMGRSNAGAEFYEIGRFRAIENGRSFVLAANTGPTAAFDPLGRPVGERTDLMTQGQLIYELPVWTETTFYTRFGSFPLVAAALVSAVWLVVVTARSRAQQRR